MKNFKIAHYLLGFSAITIFSACTNSTSSKGIPHGMIPVLTEQSISQNGCLNVNMLQGLLGPNASDYPAIEVTTDYKPDTAFGTTKALFHTHAAFDVRETSTANLQLFLQPVQNDCQTVVSKTASGETLNFKVTKSSPRSISLALQKPEDAQLSTYRQEGLEHKYEPIRYEIEALENMHLRVVTTFRSFDAHCRSNKIQLSTITKDYYWAKSGDLLPKEVAVSEAFYNSYLSTLKNGNSPEPMPVPGPTPEPTPAPETPTDPANPQPQPVAPVTPQPVSPEQPTPVPAPENPVLPSVHVADAAIPGEVQPGYIAVSVPELKRVLSIEIKENLVKCTY